MDKVDPTPQSASAPAWPTLSCWCLLFMLVLFSSPIHAQGQETGVDVQEVSPITHNVLPGTVLSCSLGVTNALDSAKEFQEVLSLPAGWMAITPPQVFSLDADDVTTRILAIQVPRNVCAGTYVLGYTVYAQDTPGIADTTTLIVTVAPVLHIALSVVAMPDMVVAGMPYEAQVLVENQGTAAISIALAAQGQREGYTAQVCPNTLTLPPAGSQLVRVYGTTPLHATRLDTAFITLTATGSTLDENCTRAEALIGLKIIPRVCGKLDLYNRIPGELVLRTVGGDDAGTEPQVIYAGEGYLDYESTRFLGFRLMGPNTSSNGRYGQQDEYRLSYRTPSQWYRLGDMTYGLTPLTAYYQYVRGVAIDFQSSWRRGAGLYVADTRWGTPNRVEGGAYVRQALNAHSSLQLNYFTQRTELEAYDEKATDQIATLLWDWNATSNTGVQVEIGRSNTDRPTSENDTAYMVQAASVIAGGYLGVTSVHAGPAYFGYYHDVDYLTSNLVVPLTPRLSANAAYSQWQRNLDLEPDLLLHAPRERYWRGNVNYNFSPCWTLQAGQQLLRREDRLTPMAFDNFERQLYLSLGHTRDRVSWNVSYFGGPTEDRLSHTRDTAQDYQVLLSYIDTPERYYTVFGGISNRNRESFLQGGTNYLGASVTWRPSPRMLLVGWFSSNNIANGLENTNQISAYLRYTLQNGNSWTLNAFDSDPFSSTRNDIAYSLDYAIPLSLPVGYKQTAGGIRGCLRDASHSDMPPIANAILYLNNLAAVTDHRGNYLFPNLPPGQYRINVDRESVGFNCITKVPDVLVLVNGGKVTTQNIEMITAASLRGSVRCYPNAPDGSDGTTQAALIGDPNANTTGVNGLANILVELTNGTETLRRETGIKGDFYFEHLRPGTWTLVTHEANVPAYHYIEVPEMALNVPDTKEVLVKIFPQKRLILMQDEERSTTVPVVQPIEKNEE